MTKESRFVVMKIECPHYKVKQKVHVAINPDPATCRANTCSALTATAISMSLSLIRLWAVHSPSRRGGSDQGLLSCSIHFSRIT
jgi:hypothetical protein